MENLQKIRIFSGEGMSQKAQTLTYVKQLTEAEVQEEANDVGTQLRVELCFFASLLS